VIEKASEVIGSPDIAAVLGYCILVAALNRAMVCRLEVSEEILEEPARVPMPFPIFHQTDSLPPLQEESYLRPGESREPKENAAPRTAVISLAPWSDHGMVLPPTELISLGMVNSPLLLPGEWMILNLREILCEIPGFQTERDILPLDLQRFLRTATSHC
jgi:hypothetical protein